VSVDPVTLVGLSAVIDGKSYTIVKASYARGNLPYRDGRLDATGEPERVMLKNAAEIVYAADDSGQRVEAFLCMHCYARFEKLGQVRVHQTREHRAAVAEKPDRFAVSFSALTMTDLKALHRAYLALDGRLKESQEALSAATERLRRVEAKIAVLAAGLQ